MRELTMNEIMLVSGAVGIAVGTGYALATQSN